MMYVSQIIMLYTLNLYSAVCQLYLSKTGRKKLKTNTDIYHRVQYHKGLHSESKKLIHHYLTLSHLEILVK